MSERETPIVPLREVLVCDQKRLDVIAVLERALADAKEHSAFGCMVLLECPDELRSSWTRDCAAIERLGKLEMLKMDWVQSWGRP